jgi:hypothetical protein
MLYSKRVQDEDMKGIVQLLQENHNLDAELRDALRQGESQLRAACDAYQVLGRHSLRTRSAAVRGSAGTAQVDDKAAASAQ